jgi:hypothetical protein
MHQRYEVTGQIVTHKTVERGEYRDLRLTGKDIAKARIKWECYTAIDRLLERECGLVSEYAHLGKEGKSEDSCFKEFSLQKHHLPDSLNENDRKIAARF